MKTRILLFALMFTGIVSYAQQDAQFTQYMYNTINVNPAKDLEELWAYLHYIVPNGLD
jgi:hypothetical protein